MDTKKLMWDVGCGELTPGTDHYAVTPAHLDSIIASARLQGQDEGKQMAQRGVVDKRIAELEEENAQLREQNDAVGKACAEMEQELASINIQTYKDAIKQVRGLNERIAELEQSLDGISQQHAKLAQHCEMLEQQLAESKGFHRDCERQLRLALRERDEFGHGLIAILERAGEGSTVGSVIAILEQERSKREPLTDDEAKHLISLVPNYYGDSSTALALRVWRAAEQAHGIGEQG